MVLHVHRNHKAYKGRRKGGKGYIGRGEVDYIELYRYTVTTGMTPALRWAAMRGILFH